MKSTSKKIVKLGLGQLEKRMTEAQAKRYGDRNMPADLRKAGFETFVFKSDPAIHFGDFYRINYGKKC